MAGGVADVALRIGTRIDARQGYQRGICLRWMGGVRKTVIQVMCSKIASKLLILKTLYITFER